MRLLLLHPHVLFRASLARFLTSERCVELAAECSDVPEALARLAETKVDLVLLDFSLWQSLVPAARVSGYTGRFLAIADEIDPRACIRALSQGVSGVVLGSDSPEHLIQAIQVVGGGAIWIDQSVIQLLVARYPWHEDFCMDNLSEREQAVLEGILGGLTNRKIADRMGASEATVKATLQHLFQKTGVRTRSQLVRIILAESLVPIQQVR